MKKPQRADHLKILEALPKEPSAEKRHRVLSEIAEAFRGSSHATQRQVQELGEALARLLPALAVGDRAYLSEYIAGAAKTPTYLVRRLMRDVPEVAAPILAASPILTEADLAQAIEKGGREVLIAVAQRPGLPASLQALISASGEVAAIDAMLANESLTLASELIGPLLVRARTDEKIASHLAARPEVSLATAAELFFSLPGPERIHLVQSLGETAGAAVLSGDRAPRAERHAEAALVKAARSGTGTAIAQALAHGWRLGDAIATRILQEPTGEALAVLCVGLGISRPTYSSLIVLSHPETGEVSARSNELLGLYEHFSPAGARRIAQGWRDGAFRKSPPSPAAPAAHAPSKEDLPAPARPARAKPKGARNGGKAETGDTPPPSLGVTIGTKKSSI
jgi:uncharacterized protein (DUF2336 family)